MSFNKLIKNVCESIGKDNNPAYVVVAIATAKGIFRPLFTMMDKKESPDARKYAALRELMTEFIGVPTTMTLGLIGETLAGFLAKKGSAKYKNASSVLSFLGICMAAGYFVPKFCNIGMPPVMKKLMPNYDPNAALPVQGQPLKVRNNSDKNLKNDYYNIYHNTASAAIFLNSNPNIRSKKKTAVAINITTA